MEKDLQKTIKTLTHLSNGTSAEIYAIGSQRRDIQSKLLAMGVLPGRSIRLITKFPSYVFQIGHSQFTVDHHIAQEIYVR